jgi:FkbM family methyltransferase
MAQRLRDRIANKVNEFLRPSGIQFTSLEFLRLKDRELDRLYRLAVLAAAGGDHLGRAEALELVERSRSQLGQDLFALASNAFAEGGFFVEFGATDGVNLSNTHLLEKHFGWSGLLAEPGKRWQSDLARNRSARISTSAVWAVTGELLSFSETSQGELSTLTMHKTTDKHGLARQVSVDYEVNTISLLDLLNEAHAPSNIEFLSIDTEGSEWEILEAFNFSRYTFNAICIEHNFTPQRGKIRQLLEAHGYRRVLRAFSQWDDWYVGVNSPIFAGRNSVK